MTTVTPERRDRLLSELIELFLARGFGGMSLSDLAAALHCSKSTLYSVGHSKEQLTVNTVVEFFRRATVAVETATAGAGPTAAAQLVSYLHAVAAELRPASGDFMADLAALPSTQAVYEQNTLAAAARVRQLIAEGVRSGEFRRVHGDFVSHVIAATMRDIQTGVVLGQTGLHDAEAYEELAALVLQGLCR